MDIEIFRNKLYDKVFNHIIKMDSIQNSPAFRRFIKKIDNDEDMEVYGLENSISLLLHLFIARLEFEQRKNISKKNGDALSTKKTFSNISILGTQKSEPFQLEDMLSLANELVIGSCKWILEKKIFEGRPHFGNGNFDEYHPSSKKEARILTIDILQAFSAIFPPTLHSELITSLSFVVFVFMRKAVKML